MIDPWLRAASVGLCFFSIGAFACSGKEVHPPGGPSGQGGTDVVDPGDGGQMLDGAAGTSAGGAAGGRSEGGIIITNPVSDAAIECDGGRAVTKIDLLFMIDNSSSMADKQAILAAAVPDLVSRLVDPPCVDGRNGAYLGQRRADGTCANGVPDFDPVKDIHVGIVSSSLGGHGSTGVCDDPDPRKTFGHNDDHGHLLARGAMDAAVPTFMNQGFLNWNPNQLMGQVPNDVASPFATMVTGVGQHGCGYEASLEAIYRFLIDPDPYQTVAIQPIAGSPIGTAVLQGTDAALLQQRADFLRPDSLVAVVMITDENDCSVQDVGQAFYSLLQTNVLGHGTSACLTNPNDRCCINCGQSEPAGCAPNASDSECQKGTWTAAEDPPNLRCWHQKQRYGVDFLYPVQRYVDGFKQSKLTNRAGAVVQNPLYDDLTPACKMTGRGCAGERDKSMVFLAGIVGVPWQDIAANGMDLTQGYFTPAQIAAMNVWPKILGVPFDPAHPNDPPIPPTDPHMIESIAPRMGLPPPGGAVDADPIHGHEWDPSKASPPSSDLQYACTFPLPMTKTCTENADCDCFVAAGGSAAAASNPLCQNGATYSNVQRRAKGYPGIRELQVLQGVGEQAIVASICPANTSNTMASDYGYRPVIASIINRLRNSLRGCYVVR